jgi:formylglycine-generating enzyme required for sulfatase activity
MDADPTDAPSPHPNCAGLAATCGPSGNESCCATATTIPSGTYYRSYDASGDGMYPNMSYPATVSSFQLDRFEVTVGRFRAFVAAGMGTQASPPTTGAGARTLNGSASQGGWDATWDASLTANTTGLVAAVKCDPTYQTWTDVAGANENLPMNCVNWYEAMAFCTWNYAASGGSDQRSYPWSSPAGSTTISCSNANYDIGIPSGTYCVNGTTGGANRVGSESPGGDGKWGQSDLGGNVDEWTLDWYQSPYASPCVDCADLTPGQYRVFRGGGFYLGSGYLRGAYRGDDSPDLRYGGLGVRCARTL